MQLNWNKCEGDQWCNFYNLNLSHAHFQNRSGVYIIWHGGQQPETVYVGQGMIADRLADHRKNAEILKFSTLGLFVTWAQVDAASRDGVERFLAERLKPKVPAMGGRYPQASPISVNFPW